MKRRHLALLFLAAVVPAEDKPVNPGKALYERAGSCIACHQANGQGVPGAFPPLAGSEWVTGDAATLIRIADHGLEGEITVAGQPYRGVMPGQGTQYDDLELAELLTYIRKSWGNNAKGIGKDTVAEQRRLDAKRDEKPWTAEELRPGTKSGTLVGARTRLFLGSWHDLPGAEGLKPVREVEGVFDRNIVPATGAVVHTEGTITVAKAGNLQILLRCDQPARISVDGRVVLRTPLLVGNDKPVAVPRVAGLPIEAGEHRVRIEVLVPAAQTADLQAVALVPGMATPVVLAGNTDKPLNIDRGEDGLDLDPAKTGGPLLYRGVLPAGLTSNRSIAVGFPEGQSLCFDAVNATWSMVWTGPFFTGRHHWSGRGLGYREWPSGDAIALLPDEPPLARLAKPTDAWPARRDTDAWPDDYRFLGYDLDGAGRPTFRYQVGKALVTDRPEPLPDGLRRHLRIEAMDGPLTFRPAAGRDLVATKTGVWTLERHLSIAVAPGPGITLRDRTSGGRTEVLVDLAPGTPAQTCTVTYRWEDTP